MGSFLKRLEIYATIPPTPTMTDFIVEILVELLSVLALASKQIKEGRFSRFDVTFTGRCLMCCREIQEEDIGGT